MFWFTTTGWMMWNFLVGGLLSGAAIVLYDGSPAYPDLDALWRLAERTGVTVLGLGAGLLAGVHEGGDRARPRDHDLSALRAVGSTGSPLAPGGLPLGVRARRAATSGCSPPAAAPTCAPAFVGGVPAAAGRTGASCRPRARLGAKVEAWDARGRESR